VQLVARRECDGQLGLDATELVVQLVVRLQLVVQQQQQLVVQLVHAREKARVFLLEEDHLDHYYLPFLYYH
jgi:hypothetical protein